MKHCIFISRLFTIGIGWVVSCFTVAYSLSLPSAQVNRSLLKQMPERLQQMIPLYERVVQQPWPTLPLSQPLKKGMQGAIILLLRERLCKTQDLVVSACVHDVAFDESVEQAVRLFQERHGLKMDGIIGGVTRTALNVSPAVRLKQIKINLSRWTDFMQRVNDRYIWINIPDHRLRLVQDHQAVMVQRVIVGKPSRQTPEIDSEVTRIILNPYWYVPPGIMRRDVIPKAMAHPGYLKQQRLRIFAAHQPHEELKYHQIDWADVKQHPSRYIVRQDPGLHNALGQIKFEFDNPHLVYLHDTPAKELFAEEKRLFSSGCIRVKDPLVFLAHLMEGDPSLEAKKQRIHDALLSGRTTIIELEQAIPIHITYITAWVDEVNRLHFWDDVYRYDQQIRIDEDHEQRDLPQPV